MRRCGQLKKSTNWIITRLSNLLLKFKCKIMHEKSHCVCFIVRAIPNECDYIRVEIPFNWLGFFLHFGFRHFEKHSKYTFFFNLVSIFFLTGVLIIDFGEGQANLELGQPLVLGDQTLEVCIFVQVKCVALQFIDKVLITISVSCAGDKILCLKVLFGLYREFRIHFDRIKLDSFTIFHLNFIDLYDIVGVHPDLILLKHMFSLHFNTFILGIRRQRESVLIILGILVYLAYLCYMLYKRQHLLFAQTYLIIWDVIANHALLFVHGSQARDLSQILNLIGSSDALLRLHELNEEKQFPKLFTSLVWFQGILVLDEETVKRALLRLFQLKLSISIHFYY